ncbi:hypothetical protein ABH935_007377 [Catenulispora sp. GAS73]
MTAETAEHARFHDYVKALLRMTHGPYLGGSVR